MGGVGTPTGQREDEDDEGDDDPGEPAELLLAMTTPVTGGQELLETLQSQLPSKEALGQEATVFMQKIKESKYAGNVARKERERRRRRVLVEQHQEQRELEERQLEEVLTEKLTRESNEERRI